jgi:Cu2+-exporting ATPase
MTACCPADAAAALAQAPAAATELDHLVRETRPGVGLLQLIAPGMHCGGCVATLERGLRATPGVVSARANLTAKRLMIEFDREALRPAALVERVRALGFDSHPLDDADAADAAEKAETRDLLKRMAVAGFAAMNIILLSVSVWSGAEGATRDLMHWISGLIALPTVVYAGRPFYVSALAGLRAWRLNMDAPISLAVILAAVISVSEVLRSGEEAFFDAAVMLLFLLLVGRYLDRLMRARARSAAGTLARLQPRGAVVVGEEGAAWRPLAEIAPGALVQIAPGDRIAVDGEIVEGRSDVDCSHLTGESAPETVSPGASVQAGALNLSGALTVRTTAVGEDSSLGEIQRLMAAAESRKGRAARLADQAAAIYAPAVHLVALLTLIGWLMAGAGFRDAAFTAIAVLIITCPCALGLAAPMAQATASGALFRRGMMLKDGAALERLAQVTRVVFDKTGTLTTGQPVLHRPPQDADPALLAAGAALAARSRHPLSQAFATWAAGAGLPPPDVTDVTEEPGLGISGMVEGLRIRLGRADFVGAEAAEGERTQVWLAAEGAAPLALAFEDTPRADAAETVRALARDSLAVEMLSGDRPGPVEALARRLGIAEWRAEATPQDKIAHVQDRAATEPVLMVGDGINDAPALAAATVSMAPASGADIGRAAADLVFFGEGLKAVAEARVIAVRTRQVILQNFAIAAGYNLIAVPVAVLGGASPLVAAIAMSSSSLLVVANALRLQMVPDPFTEREATAPEPQQAAQPA